MRDIDVKTTLLAFALGCFVAGGSVYLELRPRTGVAAGAGVALGHQRARPVVECGRPAHARGVSQKLV
jgi:hypothetical protein